MGATNAQLNKDIPFGSLQNLALGSLDGQIADLGKQLPKYEIMLGATE